MLNWEMLNQALLSLVLAVVWLFFFYGAKFLRQRLSAEQLAVAKSLVAQAVLAAEQYGGPGTEKKKTAVMLADNWLQARGYKVDLNSLDAAIEAAVYEEINRFLAIDLTDAEPGADGHKPEAAE